MLKEIEKALRKDKNIIAAYIYGSVARGTEMPESDIDIAVILKDVSVLKNPYFESELALDIENKIGTTKSVDLKVINNKGMRFTNQVIKHGKLIYTNDENFTRRFETILLEKYLDFRPFMKEYDRIREKRMGVTELRSGS